jgi:sulfide:quinone oxidoreductase
MTARVLVLGAGFGGLELTTLLSEALGRQVKITLVDRNDGFTFGFSKLDVLFGRATAESVRTSYAKIAKPGVRFLREAVTAIDPIRKSIRTEQASLEADFLVVALGADYDLDATPGLASDGHEFYSVPGAARAHEALDAFRGGRIVVGICGAPYKCPPAPSEAALLLHDHLTNKGIRKDCEITLVSPFPKPVPPSPETSRALLAAFQERDIRFLPERTVRALDGARRVVSLDDGSELPYDLFLGVPRHRAPSVVAASGLAEGAWVPVNPRTLETRFPGVYAIGDVAETGAPKAGTFAEGAARAVASSLIAALGGGGEARPFSGTGSCYVEFGGGRVARVDVDFFSGPAPSGTFHEPSLDLRADKETFGSTRRARWFGP